MNTQRERLETHTEGRDPEVRRAVLEGLHAFGERTLTFSAETPGPRILVIGGMHGNEILGVLAVDALRRELESGETRLERGTVRLLLGNTRAIALDRRTVPHGNDFNRMLTFPYLEGRHGDWEERRIQEIARAITDSDIVIDLHSTNRPSPAFVCASSSPLHESVYRFLPREAVVVDPHRVISGGGGSADELADDVGAVGICYESGQATDTSNLVPVLSALKSIMGDRGMIDASNIGRPVSAPEYVVVDAVPYRGEEFVFSDGKGRSFAPVSHGEVIGWNGDVPVVSELNGVILFPKRTEDQAAARVVCYLARRNQAPDLDCIDC